ncbi:MAG: hypothetical protein ACPIA8_01515, partial [Candidatus Puniceispirillaceae bacterium]
VFFTFNKGGSSIIRIQPVKNDIPKPDKYIRAIPAWQENQAISKRAGNCRDKRGAWLRLAATSTDEGDKLGGTMKLRSNTIQAKPVTNKPAR